MKKTIRNISCLLLVFSLLPLLSGCNNEDDIIEILTGKTWKLSRLANKDSNRQFYSGLWKDEEAERKSRDFLKIEGNFTLNFEGSDVNGELMGTTVTGHGIHSNVKINGSESDPLGKAFIAGLQNVYKYEGDANSLTLYFKDGETTRVMGFTPLR